MARAPIGSPEVAFADEPTGQLDTMGGHALLAHPRACVRGRGRTVAMVTHDPIAASFADRAVLFAGELARPTADACSPP